MRRLRLTDDPPGRLHEVRAPDPSVARLTARERQVALLVAEGLGNAEIARRLGMSANVVANTVRRIRWRIFLATRAEIAAWVRVRRVPNDPEGRLCRADDHPTGPAFAFAWGRPPCPILGSSARSAYPDVRHYPGRTASICR